MVNQATNRKKKSSSVPKKSRPQFSVSKEVFSDILTTIQHKLRDQGIEGALLSKQVKEKKIKSPFHVLI